MRFYYCDFLSDARKPLVPFLHTYVAIDVQSCMSCWSNYL